MDILTTVGMVREHRRRVLAKVREYTSEDKQTSEKIRSKQTEEEDRILPKMQDRRRTLLATIAFVAGGVIPVQLVTFSFGYSQYIRGVTEKKEMIKVAHEFAKKYIKYLYAPSQLVLATIAIYSKKRYPDLFHRITVGASVGMFATLILDAVRQLGVIYEWLPSDTPELFGKMATGSTERREFLPVGLLVHFLNGASFGVFYAFVWGKRPSYLRAAAWSTVWSMILEVGMMMGPPMERMVGPFGVDYKWPQLSLVTTVAHVLFGLTMGPLINHFLKEEDRGWLIPFLIGKTPISQNQQ